jgi:transmembrane sensor
METKQPDIDLLIAKYLAGEALPDEAIQLDQWIALSSNNMAYFEQSRKALGYITNRPINTAQMWQHIEALPIQKTRTLTIYRHAWRIAATIMLVSFLGIIAYNTLRNKPDTIIASSDNIHTEVLADGSKTVLNKNTTLTIAGGFNSKTRKMSLQGEAYFDVVHNEEKPFIIEVNKLLIKDIGTTFNVLALPLSDTVEVQVIEGIVELQTPQQTTRINKNQSGIYVKSSNKIFVVSQIDPNVSSYTNKSFVFKAQTLKKVIQSINKVYGNVLILDNNKLEDCVITVSFNGESPETIAMVIAETFGLQVAKRNTQFVLSGSTCLHQP